jgi:hypothetical protein
MEKALAIALVCAGLAGCYATGQPFTQAPTPPADAGHGHVYFYRQPGMLGGWVTTSLFIDGRKVGSLAQNGFTWMPLAPGVHRLGAAWGAGRKPEVQVFTRMDTGTHYFRLSTTPVPGGNEVRISHVTQDVAIAEMADFKYEAHQQRTDAPR